MFATVNRTIRNKCRVLVSLTVFFLEVMKAAPGGADDRAAGSCGGRHKFKRDNLALLHIYV